MHIIFLLQKCEARILCCL